MQTKGLVRLAKKDEPNRGHMVCTECGHLPKSHYRCNQYGSDLTTVVCSEKSCECFRALSGLGQT